MFKHQGLQMLGLSPLSGNGYDNKDVQATYSFKVDIIDNPRSYNESKLITVIAKL